MRMKQSAYRSIAPAFQAWKMSKAYDRRAIPFRSTTIWYALQNSSSTACAFLSLWPSEQMHSVYVCQWMVPLLDITANPFSLINVCFAPLCRYTAAAAFVQRRCTIQSSSIPSKLCVHGQWHTAVALLANRASKASSRSSILSILSWYMNRRSNTIHAQSTIKHGLTLNRKQQKKINIRSQCFVLYKIIRFRLSVLASRWCCLAYAPI